MSTSRARELAPALSSLAEGYGSAYERYAINRFLERLVARHSIRTIAEWPANGVLGVPGIKTLAAARAGCAVTLLHPDASFHDDVAAIWRAAGLPPAARLVTSPEDDRSTPNDAFDLVWSFCAIEHVDDPLATMRAMLRAARGHVLIFVQNTWAPGVHLHRLEHRITRRPWDHGAMELMRAESIARVVERAGGDVVQIGGCDLPPWPDLNVKLPRPWQRRQLRAGAQRRYGPGDPVMTAAAVAEAMTAPPALSATMRALLAWHDAIETRIPQAFLRFIAHHPFVLARRRGGASLL